MGEKTQRETRGNLRRRKIWAKIFTENVKKGKKENMGDKTKLDGKREKRGRKIGARKKSRVREKREKNKGH